MCQSSNGFHLSQVKYTLDLLKKFHMFDFSSLDAPMVTGSYLSANEGTPMTDPTLYMRSIGSLQYLITARLDIPFDVNKLSQFLSCPTDVHFQGVKRIF